MSGRNCHNAQTNVVFTNAHNLWRCSEMPTYEFECRKCGHKFNMLESISEHDKHKEKCPKCDAQDVKALVSTVNVKTSKKS